MVKRKNGGLFYKILKRLFDIIIATLMLIPTGIMAIFIKTCYLLLGDKDPILFKQKRVGRNGKYFTIYKFRSMVPNAQKKFDALMEDQKTRDYWLIYRKIENDPRITPVGKIIRHYSIDELPQCLNVLKGEMSVIGPRPLIAGELELYGGDSKFYRKIKPGITGWWACNGRSSVNWIERLSLEYYYVENANLLLDVRCLLKTASVLIKREGAD